MSETVAQRADPYVVTTFGFDARQAAPPIATRPAKTPRGGNQAGHVEHAWRQSAERATGNSCQGA
jgi:hypothetical protein